MLSLLDAMRLRLFMACAVLGVCFVASAGKRAAARNDAGGEPGTRRTYVVQEGQNFICTPTRVWDGDGPIWCKEGPKIRLAGISAREIDGSCMLGHPCSTKSGDAARDHLVVLLGGSRGNSKSGHVIVEGPRLTCESTGHAKGSRTGAWCQRSDGVDLSCAMLKGGYAVRWASYDPHNRCRYT